MNRAGVVQSSPVAAGNPNWWNINTSAARSPPTNHHQFPPPLPTNNFHLFQAPQINNQYFSSPYNWVLENDTNNQDQITAASWSQLFMSGLVGDEEKALMNHLHQQQAMEDHSCITTTTTTKPDPPPTMVDRSSECNSSANVNGGAVKKARVQSSATQSTFKVRKFGDRITALHQLVSPFGKTDTASVLLEAIGYIRFLQSQIEALSLPYMGSGSANHKKQQHPKSVQGERNCIFPEDPGQLLNDNCLKRKGGPDQELGKDLRSRGLCLVPVSCTLHVGRDNGADYWAPVLGGFREEKKVTVSSAIDQKLKQWRPKRAIFRVNFLENNRSVA
ncbi:hypothetical protein V2J09_002989 [Rumex salicifolius]